MYNPKVEHSLALHEYVWMIVLTLLFAFFGAVGRDCYIARTEMLERTSPMAKNYDVVSLFLDHSPSQGAVSTDGEELKSYSTVIARWDGDEIVMPGSSVFHSITTTKHRNLVRSMSLSRGITVKEVD